jgi:hypothetical protein
VAPLAPFASVFVTTAVDSARSLGASELAARIGDAIPDADVEVGGTPEQALALAFARSSHVVVAGSIFLVGPTRARLIDRGARPARDVASP